MNPEKAPIDGDYGTATGEFWVIVCTETRLIDHQSPEELTTLYRKLWDSEVEANNEALRLAGKFKGYGFAVLRSQAIAQWHCSNSKCTDLPAACRRGCLVPNGRVKWQECETEARRRLPA